MRFVDELYEFYKDRFTGDEEDPEVVVLSILQELAREDLFALLKEMDDEELYTLIASYLIEELYDKISEDDIIQMKSSTSHLLH